MTTLHDCMTLIWVCHADYQNPLALAGLNICSKQKVKKKRCMYTTRKLIFLDGDLVTLRTAQVIRALIDSASR